MDTSETTAVAGPDRTVVAVAWTGVLLGSYLPAIIWREIFRGDPRSDLVFRLAVLTAMVALTSLWRPVRAMRVVFLVLIAVTVGGEVLLPLVSTSAWWRAAVGTDGSAFGTSLAGAMLRLLMVALPWTVLVLAGYRHHDLYLTRGDLDAPAEPVDWLAIKAGERWKQVGRQFLTVFAIVVVVIFLTAVRPSGPEWGLIARLLPAAILLAGMNAFTENFAFRAAVLPPLVPAVGKAHALLLSALFFSLPHYYGFPPGIGGPIVATFLGWVLARSMVETKGFLWAWMMQMPLDILAVLAVLVDAARAAS